MALDQPDSNAVETWQDAFQYPIPAVRRLESVLRSEVSAHKAKLRTLVGASYRELLGTAEKIIFMDTNVELLESNLATVAMNCNSKIVNRKGVNLAYLERQLTQHDLPSQTFASHLALLHKCSRLISRLLRLPTSSLLAAKILVISRLLHNSLASRSNIPPFLETLRSRIASQRRLLLKYVDGELASSEAGADRLVESMCAFCLATSSSSTDALRHLLHVRVEKIQTSMHLPDRAHKSILESLKAYVGTIQAANTIFPRRLNEALASFRSQPLLVHPDILCLEELELEIHGRWIEDAIRNFTPWIKSDNLEKTVLDGIIGDWAGRGFATFMAGLATSLEGLTNLEDLIHLRSSLLRTWLPIHGSLQTLQSRPMDILNGLRKAINFRIVSQLRKLNQQLDVVGLSLSSILNSWDSKDQTSPRGLWTDSLVTMDFSNGSTTFKKEIIDRCYGMDPSLFQLSKSCEDYLGIVRNVESIIRSLRQIRWEDLFEDNEQEEVAIESIIPLLNEEDPNLLETELQTSMHDAFESLQTLINELLSQNSAQLTGEKAGFLMRLIREIRRLMPRSILDGNFCVTAADELQLLLAEETLRDLAVPFISSMKLLLHSEHAAGRTLWGGEPALPIQSSPCTFRLLQRIIQSMSDYGNDLWSPSAVTALKVRMKEKMGPAFWDCAASREQATLRETETPGKGTGEDISDLTNGEAVADGHRIGERQATFRDQSLQLLFDACYLETALRSRNSVETDEDRLDEFIKGFCKDVGLEEEGVERLRYSAAEYWERTRLLFSLLAD